MEKTRLDILLTDRGLAESRSLAQRLIMAGEVRVDGQLVVKPSTRFENSVEIVVEKGPPFVSRGGEKLQGALEAFGLLNMEGWVCADIGASTGGFTDCMLQHGAARVYAVDVGYGVLHWNLRNDPRVITMERTNARYVERFPESVRFVSIDASFISLKIILPPVANWFADGQGEVVALIKPQFEAGRADAAKGDGVIRDPEIHRKVLLEVLEFAQRSGYEVRGLIRSPLLGPKGNTEFLVHLVMPSHQQIDIDAVITTVLPLAEPNEE